MHKTQKHYTDNKQLATKRHKLLGCTTIKVQNKLREAENRYVFA